jgi:hypothetical protein
MTPRRQVLAPLGTVLAVLGVVAAVALLRPEHGGHTPAPLPLGAPAAGAPGTYDLVGTFPTGTPADAAVWTFTASDRADRLAAALHTTRAALHVSGPAQSWSFPSESATSVSPASPGPPLAKDLVVRAAAPVLAALGLDVGDAVVTTSPYGGSATLGPSVTGLRTVGLQTTVAVDRTGVLQYASGWLGRPSRGDSYPLVSAREAFDALPALVHPDLCRLRAAGEGGGCANAPTPQVTGAHLGLLMQVLADHRQALVPAWLFDVRGSSTPVAQVAVAPRYLAAGTPQASDLPLPSEVAPAPPSAVVRIDAAHRGTTPDERTVGRRRTRWSCSSASRAPARGCTSRPRPRRTAPASSWCFGLIPDRRTGPAPRTTGRGRSPSR